MSTALTPVITQGGLQAVFNATNDGLQARITHIALGDAGWAPDASASALRSERRRVPVVGGERLTPTQIHITAVEDGNQMEYWVREVGFILDDGTLLAIWSHPERALAYKAANVDLLLAFDMVMTALPADSVVVDGTGGVNLAPATTSKAGVVRLATLTEARTGQATDIAMTPAGSRIHGDARYARSAHRHDWNQIDGKPRVYPPASHNHDTRYARQSGDYANLRARATTKADVGLSNVPNYPATSSVLDGSSNKLATARAVKQAYDRANSRALGWGAVQITGFLNAMDAVLNYTVPNGTVMVGLYSYHSNYTEDRRWRVRYRSLSMV